jgi:phage baseplate assembly protein W
MNFVDMPFDITSRKETEDYFKTGEEALKNSIYNILTTQPGSVPGHPEFGTNLGQYLFEQIDPLVSQLIDAEIKYAMSRWEPRVTIVTIDVQDDPDYNRLTIKMNYVINRDPFNIEREFIFSTDTQ